MPDTCPQATATHYNGFMNQVNVVVASNCCLCHSAARDKAGAFIPPADPLVAAVKASARPGACAQCQEQLRAYESLQPEHRASPGQRGGVPTCAGEQSSFIFSFVTRGRFFLRPTFNSMGLEIFFTAFGNKGDIFC